MPLFCRLSTSIEFTELDVTSALFYTSNAHKQRETNARLSSIVAFREQRHVNVSKAYWMSSLSLHPFARRQSAWRVHSDLLVQTKMQNSYEWRRKKIRSFLVLNIRPKTTSWLNEICNHSNVHTFLVHPSFPFPSFL